MPSAAEPITIAPGLRLALRLAMAPSDGDQAEAWQPRNASAVNRRYAPCRGGNGGAHQRGEPPESFAVARSIEDACSGLAVALPAYWAVGKRGGEMSRRRHQRRRRAIDAMARVASADHERNPGSPDRRECCRRRRIGGSTGGEGAAGRLSFVFEPPAPAPQPVAKGPR